MENKASLIAQYLRRLYNNHLTTCYGGNISIRHNEGYLISQTCIDKSMINAENISYMSFDDTSFNGVIPSSEYQMHRMLYQNKNEVNSIIHAHPPFATSFALSNQSIDSRISSEMIRNLGDIAIAEYEKPGSIELAEKVREAAKNSNAILMKNHGVVVLAESIQKAYYMIELLEQLAHMTYIIKSIGKSKVLTESQINLLIGV